MYQQPQQPLPYPHLRRFFKSKWGIGCLSLLVVFFIIVGIAVATTGGDSSATSATSTPTQFVAIDTPTDVPVDTPVDTPTDVPTAIPTHPVAIPIATPKPTVASRPTAGPTHVPPTPTPCASPCNPFGYSFSQGNLIYTPNSGFCTYFMCISSFSNGKGYVVECHDGSYSKSGGITGVCSQHSGQWRILYSH